MRKISRDFLEIADSIQSHPGLVNERNTPSMAAEESLGAEWVPESVVRDALIADRLPAAVSSRTLFWINVPRYLAHDDAQLPPEDYLRHWREIYRCCLADEPVTLRGLSYVSFEEPATADDLN